MGQSNTVSSTVHTRTIRTIDWSAPFQHFTSYVYIYFPNLFRTQNLTSMGRESRGKAWPSIYILYIWTYKSVFEHVCYITNVHKNMSNTLQAEFMKNQIFNKKNLQGKFILMLLHNFGINRSIHKNANEHIILALISTQIHWYIT